MDDKLDVLHVAQPAAQKDSVEKFELAIAASGRQALDVCHVITTIIEHADDRFAGKEAQMGLIEYAFIAVSPIGFKEEVRQHFVKQDVGDAGKYASARGQLAFVSIQYGPGVHDVLKDIVEADAIKVCIRQFGERGFGSGAENPVQLGTRLLRGRFEGFNPPGFYGPFGLDLGPKIPGRASHIQKTVDVVRQMVQQQTPVAGEIAINFPVVIMFHGTSPC
jgi:hypothetical protein